MYSEYLEFPFSIRIISIQTNEVRTNILFRFLFFLISFSFPGKVASNAFSLVYPYLVEIPYSPGGDSADKFFSVWSFKRKSKLKEKRMKSSGICFFPSPFSRLSNYRFKPCHLVYICHSIFITGLKRASSSCLLVKYFLSLSLSQRTQFHGTIRERYFSFFFSPRRNGKYHQEREFLFSLFSFFFP